VYWLVNGAVSITDYSIFKGTLICNNGAILLSTGANIDGRTLSTTGAIGTTAITALMPINGCGGFSNPNITLQPIASQTVCSGTSVSFSVTATGTGLTYQWRKGTVNLVNGGNISGATSTMLTINPVNITDAAPNYNVVVSGTYPPSVTSNNAALSVNASPVPVISGVFNMCVNSGYFNYTTQPGMSNYQWTVSQGGVINYGSGTNQLQVSWIISGAQTISVNYTSAAGCNAITPTVSAVTVNAVPGQAGPITGTSAVCAGASSVSYSVGPVLNATAYSWNLPPSVVIISGTGTNSITVNYGTDAISGNISVSGNNLCGNGTVSPNFAVAVTPVPVAPVVTNTGYILFSDAPAGNQWYFEGTLIAGATSQTYDATLTGTGNYWCIVTLNGCPSDASNHQLVIVTGIDSQQSPAISIYPVPNNGQFTVSIISPSKDPFTISVYSTLGIRIYETEDIQVNGNFNKVIDLGAVVGGIYTVVIRNSSSDTVIKVLVTR
jgi:hypothetical protein